MLNSLSHVDYKNTYWMTRASELKLQWVLASPRGWIKFPLWEAPRAPLQGICAGSKFLRGQVYRPPPEMNDFFSFYCALALCKWDSFPDSIALRELIYKYLHCLSVIKLLLNHGKLINLLHNPWADCLSHYNSIVQGKQHSIFLVNEW